MGCHVGNRGAVPVSLFASEHSHACAYVFNLNAVKNIAVSEQYSLRAISVISVLRTANSVQQYVSSHFGQIFKGYHSVRYGRIYSFEKGSLYTPHVCWFLKSLAR